MHCLRVRSLISCGGLASVAKPLELVKVVEQDFFDNLLHRRFCLVVKNLHVFFFEYDRSLIRRYSEALASN